MSGTCKVFGVWELPGNARDSINRRPISHTFPVPRHLGLHVVSEMFAESMLLLYAGEGVQDDEEPPSPAAVWLDFDVRTPRVVDHLSIGGQGTQAPRTSIASS